MDLYLLSNSVTSERSLAPKYRAIIKSRARPKIRDKKVITVTILLDLIKDFVITKNLDYPSAGPRMIPTREFRMHSTNCITSELSDSEASNSIRA